MAVYACPSWAATGISGNEGRTTSCEDFRFSHATENPRKGSRSRVTIPFECYVLLLVEEIDPKVWTGESFIGNVDVLQTFLPKSKDGRNHFLVSSWVDRNIVARVNAAREFAVWVVLLLQ